MSRAAFWRAESDDCCCAPTADATRASVVNERIERFMLLRLRFYAQTGSRSFASSAVKQVSVALPTHHAQLYGENDAPTPLSVRGLPRNPRGSTWASAPGLDPAKKKS